MRLPTHVDDKSKPCDYHRIAYTDWGDPDNSQIVVCAHGLTRNCRDFDFLAKALESDFRVISVDMAGRGHSDWLQDAAGYNSPLVYLSDFENLLRHVCVRHGGTIKLYWVGVSMGGLLGILLAARKHLPITIQSLVISDIGPFVPAATLTPFADYVGKSPQFKSLDELEVYLRYLSAASGEMTDTEWRHLAKYSAQENADGSIGLRYDPAISICFRPDIVKDIDLWAHWDQLAIPVMVLRGKESDILPTQLADEMKKRHPDTEIVELAGVGHAPLLINPGQIQIARNFLLQFRSIT
ncbi:MAG: alpha/beta hydrolase [Nitrosomonas sp.]|nr:alpha/beta hydrolase [Nitrosomonas sp.]